MGYIDPKYFFVLLFSTKIFSSNSYYTVGPKVIILILFSLAAYFCPNQVRLVLAEGLELSNLFYFWLSGTLDRYLGDAATIEEREIFRENVFGISLSATGLSEVRLIKVHTAIFFVTCVLLWVLLRPRLVALYCGKTLVATPGQMSQYICGFRPWLLGTIAIRH